MSVYGRRIVAGWVLVLATSVAMGQSSSLMRWPSQPASLQQSNPQMAGPQPSIPQTAGTYATPGVAPFAAAAPREISRPGTRALELASFIAVSPVPPRKFKIHDLITIIVRQQKTYEADGRLDNRGRWNLSGKLSDWFRFYDDATHLGQDKLSNGQPGFKFDYNNTYRQESKNDREDKFTTRIQATIIDVKPNGNLVLEAQLREQHDEEEFTITLTGMCRSEDVTPDNSVLSTQLAELVLIERNQGAVRDATKRGWVPRLLEWGKVF